MATKIKVFDTTLRDGEQGIGWVMNLDQKQRILDVIDDVGLDIIELGMPAASPEDFEWCQTAVAQSLKTPVCLFSRLNESDLRTVLKIVEDKNVHVQLLGVGSEIHLEKKRRLNAKEGLKELETQVKFLQSNGVNNISVIFEDATRGSYRWLTELTLLSADLGINTITLADTLGVATPEKIIELVTHIKHLMPKTMELGIHCHNDTGLAVANTWSAINAGVDIIQTTFGGIGERAGNCALEEIFSIYHFSEQSKGKEIILNPVALREACEFIFAELNQPIPGNKPIIGEHVFSTAAGIHQDGLMKARSIYEHIHPEVFGRESQFVFNRLSSKKKFKNLLVDNNLINMESISEILIPKRVECHPCKL